MPSEAEEIVAVRREIVSLLRQQMEALNSPEGLTDTTLIQCYERQARVQELRETLQAVLDTEGRDGSTPTDESEVVIPSPVEHNAVVGSVHGTTSP
jgi:hypothetical protein